MALAPVMDSETWTYIDTSAQLKARMGDDNAYVVHAALYSLCDAIHCLRLIDGLFEVDEGKINLCERKKGPGNGTANIVRLGGGMDDVFFFSALPFPFPLAPARCPLPPRSRVILVCGHRQ